jgi:nitroreductase
VTVGPDASGAFFELATRQRACRTFRDEPVPDDVIAQVLAAGVRAPSAENSQPWVFVVVRDPATRAAIVGAMQAAWDGGARDYSVDRLAPRLFEDVESGVREGIGTAPVLVVVAADTERVHPSALGASIFPAVQNLLLAATAIGLGSTLTTLALQRGGAVADAVGLPAHLPPVAVIPLGFPARPLGSGWRRPFPEVTYRERFGEPWQRGRDG